MIDPFEAEPDNINELGIKWWRDDLSTDYALYRDHNNIRLKGVEVWLIETPEGFRTRLIIQDDKVVFESQQLDGIGVHLDTMKLLKHFKRK